MWGRTIYANVRKFLQLQLTLNLVALVVISMSAIFKGDSPMTPVQLLWLNIIMDTLGVLALQTEPPNECTLTKERPLKRDEKIMTPSIMRNIILMAVI